MIILYCYQGHHNLHDIDYDDKSEVGHKYCHIINPKILIEIDRFPQNLSSEYERTIFTKIHLDFGNSCQYLTQLSNWEQFRVWKPTLNCKLYLMRFGRINC